MDTIAAPEPEGRVKRKCEGEAGGTSVGGGRPAYGAL